MWTWEDPLGQADYQLTGTQLKIVIPPNFNYRVWSDVNNGARLMQEVGNLSNFSLVVKLQSPVTQGRQAQGILIETDEDHFIRYDLTYVPGDDQPVKLFAGTVDNGVGRQRRNQAIDFTGTDIYMLIRRAGNEWRLYYRLQDSGPWTGIGKFTFPMTVQRVGVFAASEKLGNQAAPGHTAVFDYFFNEDAPIVPEDGNAPGIVVNKVGQGTVTQTPVGPNYTCGQRVTLQATPASGWAFQNWSGDLNGSSASLPLTISRKHTVTATFVQRTSYDLFLPVAIR